MKLSLPQHTDIIARTNKFMHNVRFQILGYFEEKKKEKNPKTLEDLNIKLTCVSLQ